MYRHRYFACLTLFLLTLFCGCRGKKKVAKFPPPFCVPEEVKTEYEEGEEVKENDKVVAKIYFDNTQSAMGFFKDGQGRFRKDSKEDLSTRFFRVITSTAPAERYKPLYYVLKPEYIDGKPVMDSQLRWTSVEANEMNPHKESFFTVVGKLESQENGGPLYLIYEGDLIDKDDLTIVVSDLEEQGLQLTSISKSIRMKLATYKDYVAAVIAAKLPFNGKFSRSGSVGNMPPYKHKGNKGFYAIIAGPQEAVRSYIREVERAWPREEDGKTSWYLATTVQKWDKPLLNIFKEIKIPESANKKQLSNLIKSGKTVKDSCDECRSCIWNLQDKIDDRTSKLLHIKKNGKDGEPEKKLKIRVFEYKKVKKRTNGDSDRWRLNVNFPLPKDHLIGDLEAEIDNYQYLVEVETNKDDKEKDVKAKQKERQWKKKDKSFVHEELTLNKVEPVRGGGQVAIYPTRNTGLNSSVVYFELLVRVRQKIEMPEWIKGFNGDRKHLDKDLDKTPEFKNFMEDLLTGEGCGEYSRGTLIRMPVILYDVPSDEEK